MESQPERPTGGRLSAAYANKRATQELVQRAGAGKERADGGYEQEIREEGV